MIVVDELMQRPPQVALAERDHLREALVLDRADEPFRVRIRIGCSVRRLHHPNPGPFEELSNRPPRGKSIARCGPVTSAQMASDTRMSIR